MTAVAEEYLRGRRCVVKVGSALIYPDGEGPDMDTLRGIAEDIAALRKAGTAVVLVSSGAVAAGRSLMGNRNQSCAAQRCGAAPPPLGSAVNRPWSGSALLNARRTALPQRAPGAIERRG